MMVLGLFRFSGHATELLLTSEDIHAVVGEPARVRPELPDRQLKVVSWNIQQGVRYEAIRDTLETLDADIYLLQEVDAGARRSRYRQVAAALADHLQMNWVFAGEFQEIGQARRNGSAVTGQAVLSRFPISNAVALPFENQAGLRWQLDPLQPRRGGRMAVRVETAGLVLYNAHIESARNDDFRLKQVEELVVDHLDSPRASRPVVVAGDLNTSLPPERSPVGEGLKAGGFMDALGAVVSGRRTSIRHQDPLDWIFVRNVDAHGGRVIEVPKASDHYPLEVSLSGRSIALN